MLLLVQQEDLLVYKEESRPLLQQDKAPDTMGCVGFLVLAILIAGLRRRHKSQSTKNTIDDCGDHPCLREVPRDPALLIPVQTPLHELFRDISIDVIIFEPIQVRVL